jgi:hypothetical protein
VKVARQLKRSENPFTAVAFLFAEQARELSSSDNGDDRGRYGSGFVSLFPRISILHKFVCTSFFTFQFVKFWLIIPVLGLAKLGFKALIFSNNIWDLET